MLIWNMYSFWFEWSPFFKKNNFNPQYGRKQLYEGTTIKTLTKKKCGNDLKCMKRPSGSPVCSLYKRSVIKTCMNTVFFCEGCGLNNVIKKFKNRVKKLQQINKTLCLSAYIKVTENVNGTGATYYCIHCIGR